jgi:hypothetical protein
MAIHAYTPQQQQEMPMLPTIDMRDVATIGKSRRVRSSYSEPAKWWKPVLKLRRMVLVSRDLNIVSF